MRKDTLFGKYRILKKMSVSLLALAITVSGYSLGKPAQANAEADVSAFAPTVPIHSEAVQRNNMYPLTDNWKIQSTAVASDGTAVSTNDFDTAGWYPTTVPNTVLGALVNAGEYPDPYIGDNLAKIDESRFLVPWWYRTEFTLPTSEQGKKIMVNFQGIAYKANIWINGHQVANSNDIVGSFRTYELDISDYVTADGVTKNTIAVEVTRSNYGKDFSIYWVDWVPRPVDNNMGIWRDVFITTSGSVNVRNPYVGSTVDPSLMSASLDAYVDLSNTTGDEVKGTLTATINNPQGAAVTTLTKEVTLPAGAKEVEQQFLSADYPELVLASPQLWWPKDMGAHPLYTIEFSFAVDHTVTDKIKQKFGVREITTEMNVSPSQSDDPPLKDMIQYYVNHKPILIKAGGYSPTDLLLRRNESTNIAVADYVDDMGLNAIRDEGMFFDDRLLDALDEKGILYMTGWVCCSRWQQPAAYTDAELAIATDSLKAQLHITRVHPSMIAWMNGSDNPPSFADDLPSGGTVERGKQVEQAFLDLENKMHWDKYGSIVSSASAKVAELTGTVGGMHMDATYDYAVPAMYFEDMNDGGAFGFTSEAGPGPSIPLTETLKKIIPEASLWPYNVGGDNYSQWNNHAGRSSFKDLAIFNRALDNHYGQSNSLEEYNIKAQVQQYEAQRAQFESVNANKFTKASGWVQWMLNNAWPSTYWNLFDYYLNPNGSYFGAKKANEPVHIMFDYASKSVKLINSTQKAYTGLKANVQIYNIDSSKVYEQQYNNLNLTPDGAEPSVGGTPKTVGYQTIPFGGKIDTAYGITEVGSIPEADLALSPTYFIRLELTDSSNRVISVNSYAQTTKKDLVRYQNHNWNATPVDQYADFTDLQRLGPVNLQLVGEPVTTNNGAKQTLAYTIKNNSSSIAYAVYSKIKKGDASADMVAPVLMEDNYFLLLPGEQRTLKATYNTADLGGTTPYIEIGSYNSQVTGQKALPSSANLAISSTATASTTQGSSNTAPKAVDNSVYTKWQSSTNGTTGADPQWFKIDLGAPKTFSRTVVRWDYGNYAQNMTLEVSNDNTNWQTVLFATNTNGSSVTDLEFAPVTKRYVRMTMSGKRASSPQIGTGGTGQGVTGLSGTAAATSFIINSFELYAPTTKLSGASTVLSGSSYPIDVAIQNVTNSVFGVDATITYDSSLFSFVSVASADRNVAISSKDTTVDGTIKLKLAVNGQRTDLGDTVVKLVLKAKDSEVITSGVSSINVTSSIITVPSPSLTFNTDVKNQNVKVVLRKPAEVTALTASYDGDKLKVSWKDPSDIVLSSVKVTVEEPAGISSVTVAKGAQAAVIEGLTKGTLYKIRVSTLNSEGTASDGVTFANKPTTTPNSPSGSGPVIPPVLKDNQQAFSDDVLKTAANGLVTLTLDAGKTEAVLSAGSPAVLGSNAVEVTSQGVSVKVPSSVLKALAAQLQGSDDQQAKLIIRIDKTNTSVTDSAYKLAGSVYRPEVLLVSADGKESKLPSFSELVEISIPYDLTNGVDEELLGAYSYDEATKQWIYLGGTLDKGAHQITVKVSQSSEYAVIQFDKSFEDVLPSSWAHRTIQILASKHIVTGVTDNQFNPSGKTTRAEFAALLVRAMGLKSSGQPLPFSDIKNGAWYADDISAAYEAGLIKGLSASDFAPNALITREQMAALIVRAFEHVKPSSTTDSENYLSSFKDQNQLSSWAKSDINKAIGLGLLRGQTASTFAPAANASRAETAQAILNLLQLVSAN